MSTTEPRTKIDVPTLIAVSTVAWALVNILHEIVGHGGACIIVGVPVEAASTTTIYMNVDWGQLVAEHGQNPLRLVAAGGTMANVVTGAVALWALARKKVTSMATRCFLWLFATFSMIVVAMNMVTNPLLGFGDWTDLLSSVESRHVGKAAIVGAGLVLTLTGYVLSLRLWMPPTKGHRLALLRITAIPVVTLIIVQTLSLARSPFAALPPQNNHLLSSVFLYIHFMLWATAVNLIPQPRSSDVTEALRLPRSHAWLALGLVVFVFFVLVLGPGIGRFAGDPRLG